MDELPDLRSDADVDALMARLRARMSPPPSRGTAANAGAAASPDASDLVALHEGLASTLVRAMTVMVDALEELAAQDPGATPRRARQSTSQRRKKR